MSKGLLALFLFLASTSLYAQKDTKGWHLRDKAADNYNGISLDKAYELVKGKKSSPVIVAVIDSGIDTTHEDLRPILLKNEKEIPGNGIDEDGNGYIDDFWGWNFLGGKDGRNVGKDSYEATRVYFRYKEKFENLRDEYGLGEEEKKLFREWKRAAASRPRAMPSTELQRLETTVKNILAEDSMVRSALGKEEYTGIELEAFSLAGDTATRVSMVFLGLLRNNKALESTNKAFLQRFMRFVESEREKAAGENTPPPQFRNDVVGDNEEDLNDRFYGNADVMATDPFHGTHVAGIIAAVRNNGKGVDGVADNVRILPVRAVPDGDEHDKDIALAIRYAVDRGARVINMSFGKSFSPNKEWIDDAVRYAASKGVLLVHAAGNSAENIDTVPNFPQAGFIGKGRADNWLTVGASSDPQLGTPIASFSNWGRSEVDLFAPGVAIYSTIPGGNQYGNAQGTSMAAPVVAGVAALILSYYPKLSAKELKYILETSARLLYTETNKPGSKETISFAELSRTGGIVNAYEAMKLAAEISKKKKK